MARNWDNPSGSNTERLVCPVYAGVYNLTQYTLAAALRAGSSGPFGSAQSLTAIDIGGPATDLRVAWRRDLGLSTWEVSAGRWASSVGVWRFTWPGAGWPSAFQRLCVTYDYGSTANDPIVYVDGTAVAVTRTTAPTGTRNASTATQVAVGGRADAITRPWLGDLQEILILPQILTPSQVTLLRDAHVDWFCANQGITSGGAWRLTDGTAAADSANQLSGTHPLVAEPTGTATIDQVAGPTILEPTIGLSPTGARVFGGAVGGSDPAAQTVAITNTGTGTLSGLAAPITYGPEGTGWLTATLDTTTAPATLTLQPSVGALVADVYTATVNVTSTAVGCPNTPQAIPVTFDVGSGVLLVGDDHYDVTATVRDPAGAVIAWARVLWSSDDPAVATVEARSLHVGRVTGRSIGSTTVRARSIDGRVAASLPVTVTARP